jgi:hypothetical protein
LDSQEEQGDEGHTQILQDLIHVLNEAFDGHLPGFFETLRIKELFS